MIERHPKIGHVDPGAATGALHEVGRPRSPAPIRSLPDDLTAWDFREVAYALVSVLCPQTIALRIRSRNKAAKPQFL
jgi:hypothetical protein